MPGFWSCGFIPRPSAGIQSSRVYGFALKQVVARKKSSIPPSVPAAQGVSSRLRARLVAIATVAYIDRISAQKSIDPAWPLQNAVKT